MADSVWSCKEEFGSACKGLPADKKHEGKQYCVLHFPSVDKDLAELDGAIEKKLKDKDFDFRGVYFPGKQSLASFLPNATFEGTADFSRATFEGEADFSEATFEGRAIFFEATFEGETTFFGATFERYADFSEATFEGEATFGATFEGRATFHTATFEGETTFFGATFEGQADFSGATFGGETTFFGATFEERAIFNTATFKERAIFSEATFKEGANFTKATFEGETNFFGATFEGQADFSEATFEGRAIFFEATFEGEADFSEATIEEEADFRHATFEGRASFTKAQFRGVQTDFSKAQFRGVQIAFSNATFNAEWTNFQGAQFRSTETNFSGARFSGAYTNFAGAALTKNVDFRATTFREKVEFLGTIIDSQAWVWFGSHIVKPELLTFHTVSLHPGWFINADVRKVDFTDVKWYGMPGGIPEGTIDGEIDALKKRGVEAPYTLLAQACRRLSANAEENREYLLANEFHYWSMDTLRIGRCRYLRWLKRFMKKNWRRIRARFSLAATLFWIWRIFRTKPLRSTMPSRFGLVPTLYWALSGYGERPRRAFLVLVGMGTLFAILYMLVAGSIEHVGQAFLYSLAAMVRLTGVPAMAPLTKLLQPSEPGLFQLLVTAEGILGPLQIALLALAVRRRVMR